ncbi:hypothetical protein PI124_g16378 [Phytophthora idaei]|nr:hypothetical protein PI125_g14314 [Phytophthora idaei]KAG3141339.1 hypothetical protein PI126_g15535 [Phytophthora idaei]KAG3238671.1 hypothetical protein PI124_g16378 [Phytophthora idaei]
MFTEALVVTWTSMCAAMLYTDPRLWIVVSSSLAFAIVRVVVVPRAAAKVKSFPTLSTFSQLLFSNTLVSMLHSALSSLLAISALLTSHSLNGDYVNTVTSGEFLATSVSTGYFAYDLWDYVLKGLYVKSPDIILHHVVVLICYISALTKTAGVPLLSLALACELQSVLMHARKLLTMSNYSVQQSPLLRWVWRAQQHAGAQLIVQRHHSDSAVITGIVPPQLTYAETQNITSSFSKAVKAYNTIRPVHKSNMVFYPYVLTKLIEQHVKDYGKRKSLLSFIHLQGPQTLVQNDQIWQKICDATPGLVYRPTDRYEYADLV